MKNKILDSIRIIDDFPKKGIKFIDITTILQDNELFKHTIELMSKQFKTKYTKIVSLEARGFIFGSALAHYLNAGFVPIRKKGKLPYKTISQKSKHRI